MYLVSIYPTNRTFVLFLKFFKNIFTSSSVQLGWDWRRFHEIVFGMSLTPGIVRKHGLAFSRIGWNKSRPDPVVYTAIEPRIEKGKN